MRVLVCGGRDYYDKVCMSDVLSALKPTVVIQGWASGADRLAWEWAKRNRVRHQSYPADWGKHGRAAGPIRNQQMLDEGKPDLVVAFPGGRGTENMVRLALNAGVTVMEIPPAHLRPTPSEGEEG